MIAQQMSAYVSEKQISMSTISYKSGLEEAHVALLLRGEREMSIDEYLALCKALGVPYEYFFDREAAEV